MALGLFRYQADHNPVYASFLRFLRIDPRDVNDVNAIPFMPVSFFKSQILRSGKWTPETQFTSSGTTGASTSTHYVRNLAFYRDHARRCFQYAFGGLGQFHFLALLPSYLERTHSSLITMIDYFIQASGSPASGFYLYNHEKLIQDIHALRRQHDRRIIIWGVSFALLDFAEKYSLDLSDCIIIETGGMKGRRKEITRQEMHATLHRQFNATRIHSEYGMTELFSQAYSAGSLFSTPPWMRVLIREIGDPFNKGLMGQTGGINIIDLANFDTVAFIETEDSGKMLPDGSFEILGRLDNSDIRGCNLLVE